MNADLSEALQSLLEKFINGKALQLYPNEIKRVNAFNCEAFPKSLIVSDNKFTYGVIDDKLTDIKGFLNFMVKS